MTPANAFTDYRAQGQTIDKVIVDIATPPTGTITPFNAYVALSRSKGRQMEDTRIAKLDTDTQREWEKQLRCELAHVDGSMSHRA
ncbi:hypothetical protein CALVIDRAFT_477664 [Calocera viscosa TUFC12733]|uniref:Uncharacterized protein n=1 Tax=Calocera viscosa (strain TUFC12733) TaxID=1330018 RepID=A0A167PQ43_CALVF|nr:hypothetical protein CALVIDRAFT_477664 [Calocera viscosa TUFC12733]